MMISLFRKLQNVSIDILKITKSIALLGLLYGFLAFVIFLIVSPIINYFTGSIYVLMIIIASILITSSIYFYLLRTLESYNPLRWYSWIFGKTIYIDEEYYYETKDEIDEWLANSFPSYSYIIKTYQEPSMLINNKNITFTRLVKINFLKYADACEFKLIFNKST